MSISRRDREQVVIVIDVDVLPPNIWHNEKVGFVGEPVDTSLLLSYTDHIVCRLWEGKDQGELKLSHIEVS